MRRPARRTLLAIAVIAAAVVVVTVRVLLALVYEIPPTRSDDPNGSTEIEGPVPWTLIGAGADRRSVVILPEVTLGGCKYGWATAAIPSPTIQIRASLRDQNCGFETLEARMPDPITVSVPGPGALAGQRIGGPLYRGVARASVLRGARYPGRRAYPNVEGLRLDVASQILSRSAASLAVVGPTDDTAYVTAQWPQPGTPVAAHPQSELGWRHLPAALVNTIDRSEHAQPPKPSDRRAFTCREVERYGFSAIERLMFASRIPKRCRS